MPLIVFCFFHEGRLHSSDFAPGPALILFVAGFDQDFFDGYLARIWKQTAISAACSTRSADKLLVASILLLVAAAGRSPAGRCWAAIIISAARYWFPVCANIFAALKVSVPVTRVAKWKTTIQMVAIAFLLAGPAGDKIVPM